MFPHRSFLHAPEGLLITTLGVKYLEGNMNIGEITIPFFIGYFSHLYLADIFTASGVPISSLPLVLRKTKIHALFKSNKLYRSIYNLVNKKLCIPLIKTGSKIGNLAEGLYVLALLSLTIVTFLK